KSITTYLKSHDNCGDFFLPRNRTVVSNSVVDWILLLLHAKCARPEPANEFLFLVGIPLVKQGPEG
ncbi:MAG: hypothetical protein V3W52_10115, partial [Syntrophobacteria bacterium]